MVSGDLMRLFDMTMDRGAPLTAGDQPPAYPNSRSRVCRARLLGLWFVRTGFAK